MSWNGLVKARTLVWLNIAVHQRNPSNLKELQSSTAEIAGLYGRVARKSQCFKKKIRKHVRCSPKGMWETPHTHTITYSGQMRLKFRFLAIKENAMSGANPVFHRQGVRNWLELKEWWMEINTGKFLRKPVSVFETGTEVHLPAGQWP